MFAVEAALQAESQGMRVRLDGRASVLTCRIDGGAAQLVRALSKARRLLPLVRALTPLLVRAGIRLEVNVGGFVIGRAGSGVAQNAPARLLRLPSVHVGA